MALFRSSFVAGLSLLASGCLLAEPPKRNPRQTPPILNLSLADPAVTQLLIVDGAGSVDFSIPVRSEDVGEDISFALHRNYALGTAESSRIFGNESLPPSHLNDDSRVVSFLAFLPAPEPCYQLTLVVCHDPNFFPSSGLCDPNRLDDTAIATWWAVTDEALEAGLEGCPLPTGGGI